MRILIPIRSESAVIDWLTLKCSRANVPVDTWQLLNDRSGRIRKIDADGVVVWEMPSRESVRSDSHQVQVRVGGSDSTGEPQLEISGSPARVSGSNNVFGSGNIRGCAIRMIDFVQHHVGGKLSLKVENWRVTRIDVTLNYDLGSPAAVRQALLCLRHAEGGRYQVRTSSESVYWGVNSRHRSAKAYHKGPHARYAMKQGSAYYTDEEIELADRLLRLELTLKSRFFAGLGIGKGLYEKDNLGWRFDGWVPGRRWFDLTEQDLEELHMSFFDGVIGKGLEVVEMDGLREALVKVAASEGQGLAAFRTWSLVRAVGMAEAQASMPRATWFRHRKLLFAAGLSWADLQASNVLPFRRRAISLGAPVRSWNELRAAG